MQFFKFKKDAAAHIGGLSKPSKMPCDGWSIPAWECKVGSILRKIKGSVCAHCYALKGMYVFQNVKDAMMQRFAALTLALSNAAEREKFIAAFVKLLTGKPYFRWHDSGDIQSVEHLVLIADIARATPGTKYWLPTREAAIVRKFAESHTVPDNLTVRVSAPMVDGKPLAVAGFPTSSVHKKGKAIGEECGAYTRDGFCGPCRLCWDKTVENVSYPQH